MPKLVLDEPERKHRLVLDSPDLGYDPEEEDQNIKETVDIFETFEVPLPSAWRSHDTFRDIQTEQKKVNSLVRNFHWMLSTEEAERIMEEAALLPGAPKPIPIRPKRIAKEVVKGLARFAEAGVGATFGGTVYNWIGQFVEHGGAAVDWFSKVGSKNKEQIYNPVAEAIMATGKNIATYGKESRDWWMYQAATGWEALDEDLKDDDFISYGAGRLTEGVASSALSVLAVYLSGGAAAPALLDKGIKINRSLIVLSSMSAAAGFEHAQAQDENFLWSTLHGIADGTIEYAMESTFLEGVGKGGRTLTAGFKEGAEEFVTGMLQNTRAGILENEKKGMTAYEGAKNAIIDSLRQSPWEVAAGFIGGAGMQGGANLTHIVNSWRAEVSVEAPVVDGKVEKAPEKPAEAPAVPEAPVAPVEPIVAPEPTEAAPKEAWEITETSKQAADMGFTKTDQRIFYLLERGETQVNISGVPLSEWVTHRTPEGLLFQTNRDVADIQKVRKLAESQISPIPKVAEKPGEPSGGLAWQTAVRQALEKSRKLRPGVVAAQKKTRKERVGAFMRTLNSFLKKGMPARDAIRRAMAMLRGPLTEYQIYEGLENFLPPETIENGYRDIATTEKLRPFERINTMEAFEKLVSGTVLTPGDVKNIDKWRPELTPIAKKRVPWTLKAWGTFIQIANIPRTMLTMMGDMSGIGRQARALGMSDIKQYIKMVHRTHRSFISEKYHKQLTDEYESSEYFDEAQEMGVDFSKLGEAAEEAIEQEERYIAAPLLERIPIVGRIVRASERAFVTPINWLRMVIYENARIANPNMTEAKMKNLAQAINDLSGRSALGRIRALKTIAPLMSAFFSPRFSLSRVKLPYTVARPIVESIRAGELAKDVKALATLETRGAFQVVGRSMAMFVASNIAIMLLAKMLWPDETEIEPDLRSSDGGKIKIGNTRVDLWAGYLQAAQMYMRIITGQRKSQSGRLYDVDRRDLVETFGRSKMAPLLGLALDLYRGRTFFGEKLAAPPRGKAGEILTKGGIPENIQGIGKEIWNRIGPLVGQDFADAAWDAGIDMAMGAATLSFYGFGVQTYQVWPTAKLQMARNEVAQKEYNKQWDDLKPTEQGILKRRPELKAAEAKAIEERRKLGPGDWTKYHLKPLNDSAKRMQKALPDKLRTELELLEMTPGGVARRIKGDFYLNDKRYEAYESYAVTEIKRQVTPIIESPQWKNMDFVSRLERMQKAITNAKARARKRILYEVNRGEL